MTLTPEHREEIRERVSHPLAEPWQWAETRDDVAALLDALDAAEERERRLREGLLMFMSIVERFNELLLENRASAGKHVLVGWEAGLVSDMDAWLDQAAAKAAALLAPAKEEGAP